MIYPQFRIVAPRIHWKQKYTALQQILHKHITFSNTQANQVSIRHCLQLVIPCQSTLYGHFSQLQRWYGPPSSYIPMEMLNHSILLVKQNYCIKEIRSMTHSSFRSWQAPALESSQHFYQGSLDWDLLECKQMKSILFGHQETTPPCQNEKTSDACGFPHKLLTALDQTQLQFLIHRFFPTCNDLQHIRKPRQPHVILYPLSGLRLKIKPSAK